MANLERAKRALGDWLAMTPAERSRHELPGTQGEFAERWGLSSRTVIRWKQSDPTVAEAYRQAGERLGGGLHDPEADVSVSLPPKSQGAPPSGFLPAHANPQTSVLPPENFIQDRAQNPGETATLATDPLVREFEEIRTALIADAKRGGKGLESYMKYIGKHIIEQEQAARDSGFSDLSDAELVDEVLALVGREAAQDWLDRTAA